jgi:hypothetical protein
VKFIIIRHKRVREENKFKTEKFDKLSLIYPKGSTHKLVMIINPVLKQEHTLSKKKAHARLKAHIH